MLILVLPAFAQPAQSDEPSATENHSGKKKKHSKGAASEIGSGAGSVGGGVAKGAGAAASGAANGAVDLVTLHPIDAGVSVGTGAVKAGKDVTIGSAKGAGKIGKGVAHVFGKIF